MIGLVATLAVLQRDGGGTKVVVEPGPTTTLQPVEVPLGRDELVEMGHRRFQEVPPFHAVYRRSTKQGSDDPAARVTTTVPGRTVTDGISKVRTLEVSYAHRDRWRLQLIDRQGFPKIDFQLAPSASPLHDQDAAGDHVVWDGERRLVYSATNATYELGPLQGTTPLSRLQWDANADVPSTSVLGPPARSGSACLTNAL